MRVLQSVVVQIVAIVQVPVVYRSFLFWRYRAVKAHLDYDSFRTVAAVQVQVQVLFNTHTVS
jgi:hypothetical protein